MVAAAVLFIVSALAAGAADSALMMILARFAAGVGVGAASVLSPAYISEVTPASMRGRLSSVQQVMIISGLTGAFLVNYVLAAKAGNRDEVVKRYQAVVDKAAGDPPRGRVTFDKVCSKCHRMNGVGAEVGPDLATVRNRTADSLLADILIPSQSIAQMYEAYVVETASGGTLEGVIGEQTSTTITLVHEEGKKDVIPRSEIKQMYVSNLSAMPEDLDKEISPAQMADLIAYLKKPN